MNKLIYLPFFFNLTSTASEKQKMAKQSKLQSMVIWTSPKNSTALLEKFCLLGSKPLAFNNDNNILMIYVVPIPVNCSLAHFRAVH